MRLAIGHNKGLKSAGAKGKGTQPLGSQKRQLWRPLEHLLTRDSAGGQRGGGQQRGGWSDRILGGEWCWQEGNGGGEGREGRAW